MDKKQTRGKQTINTTKVNVEILANFFNVDKRTIVNWCKYGMPKESRGVYDLAKCFKWYKENIVDERKSNSEIRTRYWKAKATREEMKTKDLKESLMTVKEAKREFSKRCKDLKVSLERFKTRIAQMIVGKEQDEIMDILGRESDNLLRCFSRNGAYVYDV